MNNLDVRQSDQRCRSEETFLGRFLARFLSADKRVDAALGRHTKARQEVILDQSVRAVIQQSRSGSAPGDGIHRVVQVHSPHGDVLIDPSLYPIRVESLIATIKESNPEGVETPGPKWRAAIAPAVDVLMELHMAGRPGSDRGGASRV
ncbi:hypothetical protein [Thioalkalivibrio sp. ALJ1]|uniref:hypothetical protein n=1 Tax=Thioalkalivibrio sp. ALJ1 TaxID=1158144 RepID=UPI0005700BAB|nr:hypothetical protein [Thioalkalivibrio sp. ALJ1]